MARDPVLTYAPARNRWHTQMGQTGEFDRLLTKVWVARYGRLGIPGYGRLLTQQGNDYQNSRAQLEKTITRAI